MNAEENLFVMSLRKKMSSTQVKHDCCDICARTCGCSDDEKHSNNLSLKPATVDLKNPIFYRTVTDDERSLLKEVLLENLTCNENDHSIFGMASCVDSLDAETVEMIAKDCQYIFSTEYILDNFPVLSYELAQKVLLAIKDVFEDLDEAVLSVQLQQDKNDCDKLLVDVPEWCTKLDGENSDSTSESDAEYLN